MMGPRGSMQISRLTFCGPRLIAVVLLAGFMALAASYRPAAAIEIDVTPGNINPLPIALPAFIGNSAEGQELGANITSVIANDLGRSGFFNPLPPESYIEQITSF